MTSLSYELNGRNGHSVSGNDIGLIIGKGASGLKRVISGAWTMYERLQGSEKRIDEEKPKLRIVLKDHDEGIRVEIISESETMRKLAQKSLDKTISFMVQKRLHESLKTEHFLVEFPERLLGKLIGKGGANLKRLQNDIIYQDKKVQIHKDDVVTAKTARIRVESLDAEPDEDGKSRNIVDKGSAPNTDFIGWGPSVGEDYEHYIKITLSFKRDAKPFVDKTIYQERFTSMVMKRIDQIREEDSDQMDEINECLGFDVE
jgi:transcription antitermination factor NusA-like protein